MKCVCVCVCACVCVRECVCTCTCVCVFLSYGSHKGVQYGPSTQFRFFDPITHLQVMPAEERLLFVNGQLENLRRSIAQLQAGLSLSSSFLSFFLSLPFLFLCLPLSLFLSFCFLVSPSPDNSSCFSFLLNRKPSEFLFLHRCHKCQTHGDSAGISDRRCRSARSRDLTDPRD
jgi:hypothetical protein